jgi:nucleotide-binding universal stress UspA family protein
MKMPVMKTILVPVDFSKLSRLAIESANDLAHRFGASVHLVHVHEFYYPSGLLVPVPMPILTYGDDAATRRTRRLRMLSKRSGLDSENCHFLTGAPTFNEVCNLAREISADLIVMPTHGYTGLNRLLGGSTAERIVQHAPCPVLVTRPATKSSSRHASKGYRLRSIDRILVPVDFSQTSFQALEYAIEFARRTVAHLIIFHAVDLGPALTADGYAMYDLSAVEEAVRRGAEEQVQRFVRLAKFRSVQFETVVSMANPISGICDLAEDRNVDLIITATHGRTGFKHLLIGSVAEQVVRHAPRSVLVIPSHPDVRLARLTTRTSKIKIVAGPSEKKGLSLTSTHHTTKQTRKTSAHPFPERRKINKYRESHGTSLRRS